MLIIFLYENGWKSLFLNVIKTSALIYGLAATVKVRVESFAKRDNFIVGLLALGPGNCNDITHLYLVLT
jgi:hypothetical protein